MHIIALCNLDLVTLLVSQKLSLNRRMSLNRMLICSKMKNGLCKIVTKSQVVTKFNVTKSRLHCMRVLKMPKYFVRRGEGHRICLTPSHQAKTQHGGVRAFQKIFQNQFRGWPQICHYVNLMVICTKLKNGRLQNSHRLSLNLMSLNWYCTLRNFSLR